MRREGAIHGWMKSYDANLCHFRYSKRPTKGTNASKESGKCKKAKCRACHQMPASKAMNKIKGQNKKHSQDVVDNPQLFDWSLAKVGKKNRKRDWDDLDEVVVPRRRGAAAKDGFDEEECAQAIAESLKPQEKASKGDGFGVEGEEIEEGFDGYSSAGCEPLPSDEDFHRALGERALDLGEMKLLSEEKDEEGLSTDDEAFDSWEGQQKKQEVKPQPKQLESSSEAEEEEEEDDDDDESEGSDWCLCSLDEEEDFVEIDEQEWAMV